MSLEQIEQDRKPVEIPITNHPAQAIGVPIQVGAHGRRAAPVQKANHTRRTRAICPAKPISLEPFTRIVQVFLAPSMAQQGLDFGIRKAEPPIAPRRERGGRAIRTAAQSKRRLSRTGTLPHQTRQPHRIARGDNGVEQNTVEQLRRTVIASAPYASTAQPCRIISINEQYNLLIAGHLQQLNEHSNHRVNLVLVRSAARHALNVTHLVSR